MKPHTLFLGLPIVFLSGVICPVAFSEEGVVPVDSTVSLVHIGSLDSFDVTNMGKVAARRVLSFLETKDPVAAEDGIAIFDRIIPDENFGGEYTALRWLLKCELASEKERAENYLKGLHDRRFYEMLSKDDWKQLKSFIKNKYHFGTGEEDRNDFIETKRKNRFMEDFILFNNPVRESWEKSSKMIEMLDLKPGQKVADIGSGPGYFSFKFADLVGPSGKVFAVETNRDHVTYLEETIKALGIGNVVPVTPTQVDLGVEGPVDVVFICSLFHNMYALFYNEEREAMIVGFRKILAEGGKLVVVDNGPVKGTLPYHGPYIESELIIEQLRPFGFDLIRREQFIPQRYCLVFELRKGAKELETTRSEVPKTVIPESGLIIDNIRDLPPTPGVARFVDGSTDKIHVESHRSLVRGIVRGFTSTFTNKGRDAAEKFLGALESKDRKSLEEVREVYAKLQGAERVGDEYSSFGWFLDYLLADEADKPGFIKDDLIREYFEFFGNEDFKRLKLYLKNKYLLGELKAEMEKLLPEGEKRGELVPESSNPDAAEKEKTKPAAPPGVNEGTRPPGAKGGDPSGEGREGAEEPEMEIPHPPYEELSLDIKIETMASWWEYLTFSDPRRDEWEKAQRVIDFLDLKEGQTVADVGSGAGFYTFKFAEKVGATGKVYALDLIQEQLDQLQAAGKRAGYSNIVSVVSKEDDTMLPESSVDVVYLCSLYHETYLASMEYVKDGFIRSIQRSLKPGGRLVVVDNEPFPTREGAYFGPHIAKELVISQLVHYGFKFKQFAQFIPQRYVLVFEFDK